MQFFSLWAVVWLVFAPALFAQNEVETYLKTHQYDFTPEAGFDSLPAQALQKSFQKYRLILQSEFSSHNLDMQGKFLNMWLKFFHEHNHLKHFAIEYGHSTAYLMNMNIQTGKDNQSPYALRVKDFALHQDLPTALGIDFERPQSFVQALPTLLPALPAPSAIHESVQYAQKLPVMALDWQTHCDLLQDVLRKIRISWQANETVWKAYLGKNAFAFERVLWNKGSCEQYTGGYRDKNMADNFLAFHAQLQGTFYYAQMGQGHTALLPRKFPTIIASHPYFKDKVAVIGGYCHDCQEAGKPLPSGLPKKIEKVILQYCMPLCKHTFTLFDLSEAPPALKSLRTLGTFLIIAKGQSVPKN